jgi:hypothetical protein
MRVHADFMKIFVLFVLFAAIATPGSATTIHVRGASGYGQQTTDFTDCANGTLGPCEVFYAGPAPVAPFAPVPVGTATLDGILAFNVFEFAGSSQVVDVVDLGSIAPGTVFTLSSSLFNVTSAEVFSCGQASSSESSTLANPNAVGLDSLMTTFPGSTMCTPNLTTAPVDYDSTTGKFTLNQTLSGDLVLDFSPTGTTSAPEPTSLALLGVGLAALAGKLRRKSV